MQHLPLTLLVIRVAWTHSAIFADADHLVTGGPTPSDNT
jgi:hypothetical protein